MKKILILTNSVNGLHAFRLELIQELIAHKICVYFAAPKTKDELKLNELLDLGAEFIEISINRRGKNPLEEIKLIRKYKKLIKEIQPDLVLSYTIKPNLYGAYICNKMGIPIIMNITGLGSSLTTGKFKFVVKKMYKYSCSKASTVFFQNDSNLMFFLKNGLIDVAKIKLIPGSGVNVEKFAPTKILKNADDVLRFLFIGRLMKEKGIEEYLQSAVNITANLKNVEFSILGSFEEEKYRSMIEHLKGSVKYLGVVNDVRPLISQADCIVNPSYHEGMSNVLLEGGAMGKPLLASNIPGCREIIDNGINGFLFDARSQESLQSTMIKFIHLSDEKRSLMGKASREKIKNEFDRRIVIREYMKEIKLNYARLK